MRVLELAHGGPEVTRSTGPKAPSLVGLESWSPLEEGGKQPTSLKVVIG